jgi:hypothetical protein
MEEGRMERGNEYGPEHVAIEGLKDRNCGGK